ncbi:MAG: hypothetical protein L0Y73_09760 [Candidatus Aminicenantes bacterium]|nr:hypothetical protein [Candidatus Aminicenantes bacterium]
MNLKILPVLLVSALCLVAISLLISCKQGSDTMSYIYYMDSQKGELRIVEKKAAEGEEPNKIFFDNKDYTPYARELFSRHTMIFACNDLLIFGQGKAVIKGDEVTCPEGVIFIPQARKIYILTAKDIVFNEVKKTINCSHAVLEEIPMNGEKKVAKTLDGSITIDLKTL